MSLGIQLLLLDAPVDYPVQEHPAKPIVSITEHITKLHESVAAVSLYNPFWNNFRLLNFFAKRKIHLTLDELIKLKNESGVGTRQEIYKRLLQLYLDGSFRLNENQLRFLERLNPAFCDRNIHPKNPGDILIYECLSPRRLSHRFKEPFCLHLFIDLFNSYLFGCLSLERSGAVGMKLLQEVIIPLYHAHNAVVTIVRHSHKPTLTRCISDDEQEFSRAFSEHNISWEETSQVYGTIEAFEKFILQEFFEGVRLYGTSAGKLHITFERWLRHQNLTHPFDQSFNFFQYFDLGRCLKISLD